MSSGWTSTLLDATSISLVAIQEVNGQIVNARYLCQHQLTACSAPSCYGDVDLVYTNGTLQDFHLGLGASISFWVGSVQGRVHRLLPGALNA